MLHPHYDAVAASIRAVYAQPHPEMGWAVEQRSVVISGGEADTPIDLYRRLGFTDEVYWRATYDLELS